ncbi:MAG: hypothetical protein ABL921_00060 [Pirellula sp.]
MTTIHARVQAVQSRLQKQWTWQCTSLGMVIGGCAGCLLAILRFALSGTISWTWIGLVVLAGPAIGAVYSWLRSRSVQNAAVAIDRRCGLKDRTETALGFMANPDDSPVRRLQIADTESHLKKVDPVRVAPIAAPRSWVWGMALTCAAVVLAFITGPKENAIAALVSNDIILAQAARIDAGLEELREIQEEQNNPELEKLLKELAAKIEEMKQPGMDPKEALAKLSEMEASLQDMQKQTAEPQTESQLQEIGKALALAESMASAGNALSKGEMEKAAEELAKLELPELDRKTEKAVTEKLDQLQQNSSDGQKKQQIKDAVAQLCQGISQGDKSKFKDGANGLASESKKQGQRKKLTDFLRKQCQCLGECKGECESECKSQSESKKKGGEKAGLARSGNDPGDKTARLKSGQQVNITGQDSGQGEVDIETSTAPEQEQEAVRQYRQNAGKYEALSESVLESESIPLGHRQTIRRYFEMIRPQNGEADAVKEKTEPANP